MLIKKPAEIAAIRVYLIGEGREEGMGLKGKSMA